MALLDKLRKNISEVSSTVAKTSEVVVKVSGRMMDIQKVQHRMDNLEKEKVKIYAELGSLYFEKYAAGDMPADMAELCEQITECQHAINEAEQEIARLRGSVICSNCQTEVNKNARYCPKCGAEIIQIVDEDDAEENEVVNQEQEADEEVAENQKTSEEAEEVVDTTANEEAKTVVEDAVEAHEDEAEVVEE